MIDKELLSLIDGSGKKIFVCTLLSLLGLIANVTITAGICVAVNLVVEHGDAALYILPANAIIAGIIFRYLVTVSAGRNRAILGESVKKALRDRVFNKLLELEGYGDLGLASITQVALEGIEQLDLYFTSYLPQFFFAITSPVLLFIICAFVEIRAAVILLACVPLIPVSIMITAKYAKRIFAKYWTKYTTMGDGFLDGIQGLNDLKIFNTDALREKKGAIAAEEFRKVTMKVLVMQLASVTIMDLVAFGGAGAGIAEGILAGEAGASVGAILFLVLISAEFFLPLRAFGSAFHVAMNGATAGKKILSFLRYQSIERETTEYKDGSLKLENVNFAYSAKGNYILKNANLEFEERSITAIVGASGSGKTTIAKLLRGDIVPTEGSVQAGTQEISKISRESFFNSVATISDATHIFSGTIHSNFLLANPSVCEQEIWEALRRVRLEEFVRGDGGLEKAILENAENLSGGQKQRLAVAINLTTPKHVYIFDEVTSSIDAESESVIMKNIYALKRFATVILITHRLKNATDCDKIYFIEDGRAKESGTHRQLLERDGAYATLFTFQDKLEGSLDE